MPTTTELRARAAAQYLYLLVIDGCPIAFSTKRDIAGDTYMGDGRTVIAALQQPRWRVGVRYLEDGQFERNAVTFEVDDRTGRIGEILRDWADDAVSLGAVPAGVDGPGLSPGDDATAIDIFPDLEGMQVGPEAIGPAGERGYWPCISGFAYAQEHLGRADAGLGIGETPVTEDPFIVRGRRFALYRVFRDVVTYPSQSAGEASWRPWDEAGPVLWGAIRNVTDVDGRRWSIECDGPESWVYRRLGRLSQQQPVRVRSTVAFDTTDGNDERMLGIRLQTYASNTDVVDEIFGEDLMTTVLTPAETQELRIQVFDAIAITRDANHNDGIFEGTDGRHVGLTWADGRIQLSIDDGLLYPELTLVMHRKAWLAIGFDPELQGKLDPTDEHYAYFEEYNGTLGEPPGPDYWTGKFTTYNPGAENLEKDNGGAPKFWPPLYASGVSNLDPFSSLAQVLDVVGADVVYHRGQLDRPPASDPDDVTAPLEINGSPVDRQGLWVLFGKRSLDPFSEPFDETQVVRASWRASANALSKVGGDPPRFAVTGILNPRDYGFDRPPLSGPWASLASGEEEDMIQAVPALRLGYNVDGSADAIDRIALRLLLSTGLSAGWPGYGQGSPPMAATSNEPLFVGFGVRLDAEVADLGLAIPSSMVAPHTEWQALGEALGTLREQRILVLPGMTTEDIWRGLFGPAAWAWSLAGGRYGAISIPQPQVPQEGDVVVTYAEKATSPSNVAAHKVSASWASVPVDELVLEYDWNPIERQTQKTFRQQSPDPGARYRHDAGGKGSELTAMSIGLRSHHVGLTSWLERACELARWRAKGHLVLRGYPLQRRVAQNLWPGERVILTEPRLPRPGGGYGATAAVALVMAVDVDETGHRGGDGHGVYRADLLVDRDSINGLRFHGPAAKGRVDLVEDHWWDGATMRLFVDDDIFEVGDDRLDAAFFVEPGWLDLGGEAQIQVHQWDGASWVLAMTGAVGSVHSEAGASYLQLTSATVTQARRDDEVLVTMRPMPDQDAAWVQALFSPICGKDGQHTGGAGFPWH